MIAMFEGMRLINKAPALAADLFGDTHGEELRDLVPRLERALSIARDLTQLADSGTAITDDNSSAQIARLSALIDNLGRCLPEIEAWCVVKHYAGHVPGGSWEPRVWCAFLSREQAERFAPAIEKAYSRNGDRNPDRFLVERRAARISEFIAPTVTAKQYADEIRRYHG